jgi:SAM-dependent methyltransferase
MLRKIQKFHSVSAERGIVSAFLLSYRWFCIKSGLPDPGYFAKVAKHVPAVGHVKAGDRRRTLAVAGDAATPIPLPPMSLMESIGAYSLKTFLETGQAWGSLLQDGLAPASTILDIGCGCGRVTRWLVQNPEVAHYVGFDVIEESVQWCRNFLAPLAPGKCQFQHFDVRSAEYNPSGRIDPEKLVFPLGDSEADIVVAASVFTHLLERDARHYLRETCRVLKPGDGRVFLSILPAPAGMSFSGNETHMEYDEDYFIRMASQNGLTLERRYGDVLGQNVLCLKRTA